MSRGLHFSEKQLKKIGVSGQDTVGNLLNAPKKLRGKGMNKTEKRFSLILEDAKQDGKILDWKFESVSLKIAENTRYNPDFVVTLKSGRWQAFEIKGFLRDDAAVKFKVACGLFPEITFTMIREKRGGGWETIYHAPATVNPPKGAENLDVEPPSRKNQKYGRRKPRNNHDLPPHRGGRYRNRQGMGHLRSPCHRPYLGLK